MGQVTPLVRCLRLDERRKITPLMRKLHKLGWDTALYFAGKNQVLFDKVWRTRGSLVAFGQHTPLKLVINYDDKAPAIARIHHPADYDNWSIKDFKTIDECLAFLAEHSDTELYDPNKQGSWPWLSMQHMESTMLYSALHHQPYYQAVSTAHEQDFLPFFER